MQREHRPLQAGDGHVRGHIGSHAPIRGEVGPACDEVVGGFARRCERALVSEVLVIGQQPPDDVAQFVDIPQAEHAWGGAIRPM